MNTHPEPRVLLFDLGGVLVDFAGFRELGRMLGEGIDSADVRKRWISSPSVQRFERAEITPREFAHGIIGELQLGLSADEFITVFVGWARGPYPGARTLLERIHKDYRLACLSNSNQLHTPLHRRSMEPLFERYYFSDELRRVKPEPEIFEHVMRDLQVPPDRIAFFDDTPINVEAARALGITAYQVDGLAELEATLDTLRVFSPTRAP